MNTVKILFSILVGLALTGCNKWISVKPADRLSEELVFENPAGFMKALNGIYVEMADENLYGQAMTAGTVDVLSQYYYISSSTNKFFQTATFVYTDATVKAGFDAIWSKAYQLVANCNVIIEKCGTAPREKILPEQYYYVVKGEALALRAFLQFDMLRLFGPIYNDANKILPAIPYRTNTSYDVAPILSTEEATKMVIKDLKDAIDLLKDHDPIIADGVRNQNSPDGNNDFYYRQYRLNFYAVKALLTRVYLWMQDKENAYALATDIIRQASSADTTSVFPFVTNSDATNPATPDRVFSTEVMFAVYDINRINIYNNLFSPDLQADSRLSFNGGNTDISRVNELYDDANDFRKRIWQNITSGSNTMLTNLKFQDIANAPGRYMIPLIRLSEVYLIAAECSPTLEEGTAFLNKVRTARNCFDLTPANDASLQSDITKEFRKEVIGEGQQFFYYKRNASQIVPNNSSLVGTKTMVLNNYIVPLPDSEISQRNNADTSAAGN